VLSILAGIGGGWAFYLIWRRILPRARSRAFWQAVPAHASGMLHCEEPDDVLRHYRALIRQAASFAGRNTLAVFAGLLPMAALFLLTSALHPEQRRGPLVEVRPAAAVAGLPAWAGAVRTRDGGLLIDRRDVAGRALRLLGEPLDARALGRKRALCTSAIACLGYELLLFETHRVQQHSGSARSVVVRPRAFAANPLWPWLDDLELAFLVSAIAGGMAAGWLSSRAQRAPA
jgi:hypothetical protein